MSFLKKFSSSKKSLGSEKSASMSVTSEKSKVSEPVEPAAEAVAEELFEGACAGQEPKTGTFAQASAAAKSGVSLGASKAAGELPSWGNYAEMKSSSRLSAVRDAKFAKNENNIQYVTRDVQVVRGDAPTQITEFKGTSAPLKTYNWNSLSDAGLFNNALNKGAFEREEIDNGFLGTEHIDHGLIEKIDHDLVEYEADVEVLDYESQIGDEAYEQEEELQRIQQLREVEHSYYRNHYHPHEHLKTVEHNHYVDHVKNVDHIQRVEKVYNVQHKHLIEDRHLHEHVYNTQHLHNWYHRDVVKHRNLVYEEEKEVIVDLGEQVRELPGESRELDGWVKEGDSHHDVGVFEIWDEQTYRVRREDVPRLTDFKKIITTSRMPVRQYPSLQDTKPISAGFTQTATTFKTAAPIQREAATKITTNTAAYKSKGGVRTEPSYLSNKKYAFRASQGEAGISSNIAARQSINLGEKSSELKSYMRGNVADRAEAELKQA